MTRQRPNPNRSEVVDPRPAERKTNVLFPEISVSARKGQSRQRWRNAGAEKSAEAIVADLGREGLNQPTVTGNGIAWAIREGQGGTSVK